MDRRMLARRFEAARPRLLAVAGRLLRSPADAEDAVQEGWLRLERSDADGIDDLDAWLVTVVSRICLDMLGSARRTRERSWQVEPWADEPVAPGPDPLGQAERADAVTAALLVVLDALSPAERLAFVLHDVFGQPFEEVGAALQRSPAAARQLASRARRRVQAAESARRVGAVRERELVDAWLRAASSGDLSALLALLDEGAVLHADYGATSQTLEGRDEIAAQAVLSARLAAASMLVRIDGAPGVAALHAGRVVSVMAFEFTDGRITGLEVLADPERLPASI